MHDFWMVLPPTLSALGGLIVGILNSRKSGEIHTLVNSQMTNVKADLSIANARIYAMQAIIEKMEKETPRKASEAT